MCGVIGFVGSYDSLILKTGLDTIQNRGPDDHGLWFEGEVGLGHYHRLPIERKAEA